jgi:cytochrome P450
LRAKFLRRAKLNDQTPLQPADLPQHVTPDRVIDFDFYNDRRFTEQGDIHSGLMQLNAESRGIFFTPRNGGHWVINGYDLIFEAARDTETFSSRKMVVPRMENEPTYIPIYLDPPVHWTYRKVLVEAFSPKAVAGLEKEIRALAIELIDAVADSGACNFVHQVAEPLPVKIFMRMMGIPLERFADFREWVQVIVSSSDNAEREAAQHKIDDAMGVVIRQRQAQRQGDLVSQLIDCDLDGRPPTFAELLGYCQLLFVAGLDTVMNGMSFAVRHLARDPELQKRLRADPALIPEAVEEILRRYTFSVPGRIVTRDTRFGGVDLRKDDMVLLMLPAADLDGEVFACPAHADIDRENKTHIAFNAGPHRCVGSHLARLELRILYEEWLSRIPDYWQDPDQPEKMHAGHVFGIDSLPLRWSA